MNSVTHMVNSPLGDSDPLAWKISGDQDSAIAVAVWDGWPANELPRRPPRLLRSDPRPPHGIPELDSPMAG
jgi:hypothetical protein